MATQKESFMLLPKKKCKIGYEIERNSLLRCNIFHLNTTRAATCLVPFSAYPPQFTTPKCTHVSRTNTVKCQMLKRMLWRRLVEDKVRARCEASHCFMASCFSPTLIPIVMIVLMNVQKDDDISSIFRSNLLNVNSFPYDDVCLRHSFQVIVRMSGKLNSHFPETCGSRIMISGKLYHTKKSMSLPGLIGESILFFISSFSITRVWAE